MAIYVLNDFHGNGKLTEDAIRSIREIVKPGDVIEITFGSRRLCVEVTAVTENAGKAEAAAMYREV